jgi:hypothetical protein
MSQKLDIAMKGHMRGAGEHGTGRNIAPFVEAEWGSKAYELMWEIKNLFDPDHVLNPGVLVSRDPDAHRKFFKPSPVASDVVDRCGSPVACCMLMQRLSNCQHGPGSSVATAQLWYTRPLAVSHIHGHESLVMQVH